MEKLQKGRGEITKEQVDRVFVPFNLKNLPIVGKWVRKDIREFLEEQEPSTSQRKT